MMPENSDKQPNNPKKLDTQVMARIGKSITEMPIRVSNVPKTEDTNQEPPKDQSS